MQSTRAWLVVAVAFLSNAVAFGITCSFGMSDGRRLRLSGGSPVAGAVIDLTDGYSTAIVVSAAVVFGSWAFLRPFRPQRRDRSQPHPEARSDRPASVGRVWTWGSAALATVIRALAAEWRLRQAIRELESLDDHRLRDLGLTRRNIERAVRRGRGSDADVPPDPRP